MKVALCLHGLFNSNYDKSSKGYSGYEYIKRNILDKFDVDVFIHSWEPDKQSYICDLYNPKRFIFQPPKDFTNIVRNRRLDSLQRPPRPPEVVLSHLYSVAQSMKLALTDQKYDIIIKSRFDLGQINRNTSGPGSQNPYPVQCINFQPNIDCGRLYIADWNHFHMGPADMWFYGEHAVMSPFASLYDDLIEVFHIGSEFHKFATAIENNPGDLSNAIAFYKYWMIKTGLWNKIIKMKTKWE